MTDKSPDLSPAAIERLLCEDDHKRGCQGREYACICDYDDRIAATLRALAARVEALTKERDEAGEREEDASDHHDRLISQRDTALARLGAVERETLDRAAVLIDASDVPVRYILSRSIRALPLTPDAAAALERAVQAEREACADVARDRHKTWHAIGPGCLVDDDASACSDIAAAILARGKKEAGK
ncbi:hypothetical protein [Paracoccus sp. PAR01]|uniref:hypothetical protein n=1 Tax=Paracoccus sp. PAR01 TaxID=2769282 RepID=UPI0017856920|nr:hypothetical protein [Paracoccus sp. PAR01]MBD9529021.1 hypothetical protein [Paracoccus sp. PAR01]